VPQVRTDLYVLGAIADQMDVHLGLPDAAAARAELASLGIWRGSRPTAPAVQGPGGSSPPTMQFLGVGGAGGGAIPARLASWHLLLDSGRMQDGEPYLAGTARPAVAKLSEATAAKAGLTDGDKVTVATPQGSVTLPVEVMLMVDDVVWVPADTTPGASHGSTVTLRRAQ
jgi:NADH-quinone oxidoreductase subunit G